MILCLSFICTVETRADDKRPNIIFLLSDDQRDNTFAAMGHPFVQTPNVDRLLAQSVRFQNTYIAEPVCASSRASLLTGMYERVHGIGFTSSWQLTEDQWDRTYPALLQEAGYHTGFVGKFGLEYYTFRGKAQDKFDYWWGHDGWTLFHPKTRKTFSTNTYHRAKANLITPIMGEAMLEFLGQVPDDRPFCLSVSFNVPHGSQTTSMLTDYPQWQRMAKPANEHPQLKDHPHYGDLYRDIDLSIPEETATDPYRFIPRSMMNQDAGRRRTYPYNYTAATCREHHVRYYQQITGLDHEIGRLVAELKRLDLSDNTVIIFGSDHGLLMGEYGMGGKALLYDLASKIPCFVFDPRATTTRGQQADQLVSSLDITATILDYAGVTPPPFIQGKSLRPLVRGETVPWRDELFLESLYTGRDTPFQEGIRDGKWKYIRMFDGVGRYNEQHVDFTNRRPDFELLFDLDADPMERTNLVQVDAHSEVLARLRKKCTTQSQQLNQKREEFKKAVTTKAR
jgi:arylsulfatase A-like enzyme